MTINRRQLFTEAWTLARKMAAKSGTLRGHLKLALQICWAISKEAARKAAMPRRANAYELGNERAYLVRDQFSRSGFAVRSGPSMFSTPIYNGW
jgi:hypothetical protein